MISLHETQVGKSSVFPSVRMFDEVCWSIERLSGGWYHYTRHRLEKAASFLQCGCLTKYVGPSRDFLEDDIITRDTGWKKQRLPFSAVVWRSVLVNRDTSQPLHFGIIWTRLWAFKENGCTFVLYNEYTFIYHSFTCKKQPLPQESTILATNANGMAYLKAVSQCSLTPKFGGTSCQSIPASSLCQLTF